MPTTILCGVFITSQSAHGTHHHTRTLSWYLQVRCILWILLVPSRLQSWSSRRSEMNKNKQIEMANWTIKLPGLGGSGAKLEVRWEKEGHNLILLRKSQEPRMTTAEGKGAGNGDKIKFSKRLHWNMWEKPRQRSSRAWSGGAGIILSAPSYSVWSMSVSLNTIFLLQIRKWLNRRMTRGLTHCWSQQIGKTRPKTTTWEMKPTRPYLSLWGHPSLESTDLFCVDCPHIPQHLVVRLGTHPPPSLRTSTGEQTPPKLCVCAAGDSLQQHTLV